MWPSITLTSANDLAFFTVDRRPGVFAGVFMLISSSSSFLATEDFRGFRAGVFVREMAAIGASFSKKRNYLKCAQFVTVLTMYKMV